jgi:hypothetical protein
MGRFLWLTRLSLGMRVVRRGLGFDEGIEDDGLSGGGSRLRGLVGRGHGLKLMLDLLLMSLHCGRLLVGLDGRMVVLDGRVDAEFGGMVLGGKRNAGIWRGVVRVVRITLARPT